MPLKYRKYEERRLQDADRQDRALFDPVRADGLRASALLRGAAGKPDQPRRRSPRSYPLVLTTGQRIPYFFNSEHRQIAQAAAGQSRPGGRDPPGNGGPFRHREGRLDVDRDQARPHAAKGQADHRHRSARRRGRARLVVPRGAGVRNTESGQSNVNLLTDNRPPYDPAMGTYQLRALLCRVRKAEAHVRAPPAERRPRSARLRHLDLDQCSPAPRASEEQRPFAVAQPADEAYRR